MEDPHEDLYRSIRAYVTHGSGKRPRSIFVDMMRSLHMWNLVHSRAVKVDPPVEPCSRDVELRRAVFGYFNTGTLTEECLIKAMVAWFESMRA